MSGYRLIERLTARGNVVIGAGCYSAALETKNSSLVIKVGTCLSDPWVDYYKRIISKNSKNRYLPKVVDMHINTKMDYYVCKMEKLDSRPSSITRANQHYDLAILIEQYCMCLISENEYYSKVVKFSAVSKPDELLYAIDKIKNTLPEHARIDLHSGNIMYRNDEVVILDPWAETDMAEDQNVEEWLEYDANIEEDSIVW